jgi:MFS family permease
MNHLSRSERERRGERGAQVGQGLASRSYGSAFAVLRNVALPLVVIPVTFAWIFHPHWSAYLSTPNREWLPWDPAAHWLDGLKLFEYLRQGDVVNATAQTLSYSWWLPLHPLLVAALSAVAPYEVEWIVAANYVLVALAFVVSAVWIGRHGEGFSQAAILPAVIVLLLALASSRQFVQDLNQVMLEALCLALTLCFAVASTLARSVPGQTRWFHHRNAAICLLLLLMTKVHYGLFFLLLWMGEALRTAMRSREGRRNLCCALASLPRKPYVRVLLAVALVPASAIVARSIYGPIRLELGGLFVSMTGYGNPLSLALVPLLVIWTFETLARTGALRRVVTADARLLNQIVLLPFAWYYLLPFRSKLGGFLSQLQYQNDARSFTFWEQAMYYPSTVLAEYFGGLGWLVAGVAVAGLLFSTRSPLCWIGLLALSFYLPMSFLNHNKEPRFAVTLVGIAAAAMLVASGRLHVQRWGRVVPPMALAIALVIRSPLDTHDLEALTAERYLPIGYKSIDEVAAAYVPGRGGLVAGLGMDAGGPLLTLKLFRKDPALLKVVFRNAGDVLQPDLEDHLQTTLFVREVVARSGEPAQIVLFNSLAATLAPELVASGAFHPLFTRGDVTFLLQRVSPDAH